MPAWDNAFEAVPANNEDRSAGALRIRDSKVAVRERAEGEHDWGPSGLADDGDHIEGSGRGFYSDATVVKRCTAAQPQGAYNGANLGANDKGRFQFRHSNRGYSCEVWDGAAFKNSTGHVTANSSTSTHATPFDSTGLQVLQVSGGGSDWEFGPGVAVGIDETLDIEVGVSVQAKALAAERTLCLRLEYSFNGGGGWSTGTEAIVTVRQNATCFVTLHLDLSYNASVGDDFLFRVSGSTDAGNNPNSAIFNTADAAPAGALPVTTRARWRVWVR
jgi:hypothetical protein